MTDDRWGKKEVEQYDEAVKWKTYFFYLVFFIATMGVLAMFNPDGFNELGKSLSNIVVFGVVCFVACFVKDRIKK